MTFANIFTGAAKIKTGSYTGNGSDAGQDVSLGGSYKELLLQCHIVFPLEIPEASTAIVWGTSFADDDYGTGCTARGFNSSMFTTLDNVTNVRLQMNLLLVADEGSTITLTDSGITYS